MSQGDSEWVLGPRLSINVFALHAPVVFSVAIAINNRRNICSNAFHCFNLISWFFSSSYSKKPREKERTKKGRFPQSFYVGASWLEADGQPYQSTIKLHLCLHQSLWLTSSAFKADVGDRVREITRNQETLFSLHRTRSPAGSWASTAHEFSPYIFISKPVLNNVRLQSDILKHHPLTSGLHCPMVKLKVCTRQGMPGLFHKSQTCNLA